MLGANDLCNQIAKPEQKAPADRMIAGLDRMVGSTQSQSIKFIAATLTPFGNETFMVNAWNPTKEKYRLTFNEWIRTSDMPNGIADFDMAVHASDVPTQMLPLYDCGDDLHPSDVGCRYMGDVID